MGLNKRETPFRKPVATQYFASKYFASPSLNHQDLKGCISIPFINRYCDFIIMSPGWVLSVYQWVWFVVRMSCYCILMYQFTDVPVYRWFVFVNGMGSCLVLIYQFTDVPVYQWIGFVVGTGWADLAILNAFYK